MERGFHCSEAFFLCVGDYLLGEIHPGMQRMTTGFAGGVGCTYHEVCGALSGGAMVLSAIYGRTSPDQDDSQCMQLVAKYWDLFEQHFGTTKCKLLRDMGYGSGGPRPCCELVNESIRLFRTVIPRFENPQRKQDYFEV
jgi:C_GCAxxG_C_C family probable redox protein